MSLRLAIATNAFTKPRLRLFEEFSRQFDAHFTVFKYAGYWSESSTIIEIKRLKSLSFQLPLGGERPFLHCAFSIISGLRRGKFDALIAFGYGSFTTLLALVYARFSRLPVVLFVANRAEYEEKRPFVLKAVKKPIHRFASHFVASGSSSRQYLIDYGVPDEEITVVPYAIDNDSFARRIEKWRRQANETRRELRITHAKPVILYVGKVLMSKGVGVLLEAYGCVRQEHDCCLVIVGDGHDRGRLGALCQRLNLQDVHFVGSVPHGRVAQFYAIADLFVLPSFKDVWGLVINEAMVAGLPIVTTENVGAVRDLVRDGENGLVVRANDPASLAKAISRIVQDEKLRSRMGHASRQIISGWTIAAAVGGLAGAVASVGLSPNQRPPRARID